MLYDSTTRSIESRIDGCDSGEVNPTMTCQTTGDCCGCDMCKIDDDDRDEESKSEEDQDIELTPEDFGYEPILCNAKHMRMRFKRENGSAQYRQDAFGHRTNRGMRGNDRSWSRQTRDRHQWERGVVRENKRRNWLLISDNPRATKWREDFLKSQAKRELEQQNWENFRRGVPTIKWGREYEEYERRQKRIARIAQDERDHQSDLLWAEFQREHRGGLPIMPGMSPEEAQAYEDEYKNDTFAARSFLYGQDTESWDCEIRRQRKIDEMHMLDWWDDDLPAMCMDFDCFGGSCWGESDMDYHEEFDLSDPYAHHRFRALSKSYEQLTHYDVWLIFCSDRNCSECNICASCDMSYMNESALDDHDSGHEDSRSRSVAIVDLTPEDFGLSAVDKRIERFSDKYGKASRRSRSFKVRHQIARRQYAKHMRQLDREQREIECADDQLNREYYQTMAREITEEAA